MRKSLSLLITLILFNSLSAQILLNELSPDSGNNDAANDAIIELINYGPDTDAGCLLISNSEWIVVLPPGTTIPVGETFIIACSEGVNAGSNPNSNPGTGLTFSQCDFPNLPLDFDVCDPANAAYIDWSGSGLISTFPQIITRYFEVSNTATGCTNFTGTPVSITVSEEGFSYKTF